MRHCIGVYPKFVGLFIRWVINKNGSKNCTIELKGRGMRGKYIRLQDGSKMRMSRYYRYGAPVSKSDKVAIYICPNRKREEQHRNYIRGAYKTGGVQ